MRGLLTTSREFEAVAARMVRRDGVLALGVGLVGLAVEFGRARLLLSDVLTTDTQFEVVQQGFDVAVLAIVVVILLALRQGPETVGVRRTSVRRGVLSALAALVVLVAWNVVLALLDGPVHLAPPDAVLPILGTFAFPAVVEEVVYRGYITQRLQSLISRRALAQLCAVLLFVVAHLPMKILGNPEYFATFGAADALWLGNLVLIGYVYDWLYRVTGSVFPGIATHFLVNVTGALLV